MSAVRARSLLLLAPHRLEWRAELLPPPGPGEVLIRTLAGAISTGSELPQYEGTARAESSPVYPRMTGYESLGAVVACGEGVVRPAVGERVVAFYGHRTHAVVPAAKALPVPDGVSDTLALLSILTCDVAKGVRRLAVQPEEPVLVVGAGAIGLLTVWVLRAYGIRTVDVVEPRPERAALALRLGARRVLALEAFTSVQRAAYAAAFECSARDAGFAVAQEALRPYGRLCVLSDGNREALTLLPAFHERELSIVASSDGWDYQAHAAWYFAVVRDTPGALAEVFELEVAAGKLEATFAGLAAGEIQPVKVLVRY